MHPEWHSQAVCHGNTHLMPYRQGANHHNGPFRLHVTAAKAMCARCPVIDACSEWACTIPDPVPFHVAGGYTPEERAALAGIERRKPGPQPIRHGTRGGYEQHRKRGEPTCQPCRDANAAARRAERGRIA